MDSTRNLDKLQQNQDLSQTLCRIYRSVINAPRFTIRSGNWKLWCIFLSCLELAFPILGPKLDIISGAKIYSMHIPICQIYTTP